MTHRRLPATLILAIALLPCGCGSSADDAADSSPAATLDLELADGLEARLVLDGLANPAALAISPGGRLAVAEAARGRILTLANGQPIDYVTGFTVSPGETDASLAPLRLPHGPLAIAWLDDTAIAAADAGAPPGRESVALVPRAGDLTPALHTNPIPATTDAPDDLGEGDLRGLSLSPGARTLYLCGRDWVLRCDIESHQLHTFARADRAGLGRRRPLDTITRPDGSVLVLFTTPPQSTDASADPHPAIARFDGATGRLIRAWSVPGLIAPVAFAAAPDGSIALLDAASPQDDPVHDPTRGRLLRLRLADDPHAPAHPVVRGLLHPAACRFAPNGLLYIAEIGGHAGDAATPTGRIIALRGFVLPASSG